jgi:hypothetical protein
MCVVAFEFSLCNWPRATKPALVVVVAVVAVVVVVIVNSSSNS